MADDDAMQAYYARDEERDRLAEGVGRVEFALRAVESVPDLLGLGPHLLATARPR